MRLRKPKKLSIFSIKRQRIQKIIGLIIGSYILTAIVFLGLVIGYAIWQGL